MWGGTSSFLKVPFLIVTDVKDGAGAGAGCRVQSAECRVQSAESRNATFYAECLMPLALMHVGLLSLHAQLKVVGEPHTHGIAVANSTIPCSLRSTGPPGRWEIGDWRLEICFATSCTYRHQSLQRPHFCPSSATIHTEVQGQSRCTDRRIKDERRGKEEGERGRERKRERERDG